jgi:hypothetical protein
MAEKSKSTETPVELWRKIAASRELVARDSGALRYELDFPLKIRKAFQRHTAVWVGAALATGLLIALLRARTRKVYVGPFGKRTRSPNKTLLESGALLGAAKLAMTFLQPMVVSYFAKKKGDRQSRGPVSW